MSVTSMNHFTVLSDDLEATREFYVDFLGGLKVGWRPPFQFPGWWLYAGDTPILHVIHPITCPKATALACSITWRSAPRICPAPSRN